MTFLIDMHTHILPGIDDGAASVEISIAMLRESWNQGVRTVLATPHCHLKKESDIQAFIKKRDESYNRLKSALEKNHEELPEIRLGCEVRIDRDVSKFDGLEKLCIEGTNYILIEMPYQKWTQSLYDALYYMTLRKLRPIMAHIERFYDHVDEFDNLIDLELLYQINAESFLNSKVLGIMPYFFKNKMVQLIGSDMHNMELRPQKLLKAYQKIEAIYGFECVDYLIKNSNMILDNQYINFFDFKKKSFLQRILHGKTHR